MPSHLHLAHRRTARIAAKGRIVKTDQTLQEIRKRCREDFAFFCDYISEGKKKPAAHHHEWIENLVTEQDTNCLKRIGGKDIAILAPRGPLHPDTPVATPDGWRPLASIEQGDVVYGDDGKPTQVLDTVCYPKTDLYNVIFSDGTSLCCDESHRFDVADVQNNPLTYCTTTLQAIRTGCGSPLLPGGADPEEPWLDACRQPRYCIPCTAPVAYGSKDLTMDPRVFGAQLASTPTSIPEPYRFASIAQRLDLIEGLMKQSLQEVNDLCSVLHLSTSEIKLKIDDEPLAFDLAEVFRSLGCFVSVKYYFDGVFVLTINPSDLVSQRLGRKPSRADQRPYKTIVAIEPAEASWVKCITVSNAQERFLIKDYVVSKNSAKSTCLGLFTAWAIGLHAEAKMPLKILYISYTVDVARPKSAAIKNTVESKRYQEVFPTVRIKKGMTSNEYWSIDYKFAGIEETGDEQFTVCCAGLKGSITSKRSSLVIIDDCIKAASDIKNPEVRREMQDNWNSVIAPTMFEGARAICLGTRFRHDDIFATTFVPKNGWHQVIQQALIPNEEGELESYWPEMWSLDYLLKKKSTAPISFSFQYMNHIVRQSELSLSPDLLIRSEIATEFDSIGVGIDLSSGTKDRNDYTVMTLGGRVGDKIHIIDFRRFRVMGNLEKLDKLLELLADWNLLTTDQDGHYYPTFSVVDIWSEAVQYQASIEADFKRICINEKGLYNLKWHPVKGFRSDKLSRFRGIMGLFEQRKILFNRYRGFAPVFDELTNFGTAGHDDCVDSLVYTVNGLMRRGSLEVDY